MGRSTEVTDRCIDAVAFGVPEFAAGATPGFEFPADGAPVVDRDGVRIGHGSNSVVEGRRFDAPLGVGPERR